MSKTPSAASLHCLAVALVLAGWLGCGNQICGNIAFSNQPAILNFACPPTDLVTVDLSGPCGTADAGTSPSGYLQAGQLAISGTGAGTCHVVLTFGTGFKYATDIVFTKSIGPCGPTGLHRPRLSSRSTTPRQPVLSETLERAAATALQMQGLAQATADQRSKLVPAAGPTY